MKTDPASPVSLSAWFQDVPNELLGRKLVDIKQGQTIFSQGDDCDQVLHRQRRGQAFHRISPWQNSRPLHLGPGDFLGMGCLTGEKTHETTAVALVRSVAVAIRSAVLIRLLREKPPAAAEFCDYVIKRYVGIERELINFVLNSSEKRLARALLLLDSYSKNVDPSILHTITQDALADIVGTTRSPINLFPKRFKRKGYIEYDRELKIYPSLQEVRS